MDWRRQVEGLNSQVAAGMPLDDEMKGVILHRFGPFGILA